MKPKRPGTRVTEIRVTPTGGRKGAVRRLDLSGSPAMKCHKMLQALNDYVDGVLDPSICEDFEAHLVGCNPCQIVIDNVRQTITLFKAGKPYPIPLRCHKRLHRTLQEQWKSCFGRPSPKSTGRS